MVVAIWAVRVITTEDAPESLHTVQSRRRIRVARRQPDEFDPGALVVGDRRSPSGFRTADRVVHVPCHLLKIALIADRDFAVRLGSA